MAASWAGYYADRALLIWCFVWLATRWARRDLLLQRPDALYEPLTWVGALAFPDPPNSFIWYALFSACASSALICLWRPRLTAARISLALSAVLLMTPEFAYGHIEHINHLFLLALTLGVFLPVGQPSSAREATLQARSFAWYQAGLLFIYTLAGLWKWVDLTIRPLFKPGMTWLHPDALTITSVHSYRLIDLPLTVPAALADFGPLFAVGYVGLAIIFAASSFAAFRRPLLFITLPTILLFHLTNVVTLYVTFISTCFVALVLFTPYEWVLPGIRRRLVPVAAQTFSGAGASARYERRYANGDVDTFLGFYAYREQLCDRSVVLAAPLYYPGLGWAATRLLALKTEPQEQTSS